jgi:hypothetical protein
MATSRTGQPDMGSTAHVPFDPFVRFAAFEERLTNFGTRFTSLEQNTQQSFNALATQLNSLATEMRNSQKTSWGTIIGLMTVGLTIIGMVGALVWWPVQTAVTELKGHDMVLDKVVGELPDRFLSLKEFDRRLDRAAEDRQRVNATLAGLPTMYVSRIDLSALSKQVDDLSNRVLFLERKGSPRAGF